MMTYDHWNSTNPADAELGSATQALYPNLRLMSDAPRNGSAFQAVLADDEELVTVRFDTETRWWPNEDRWYDDNGDGAPDGGCRAWDTDEFLGWLPVAREVV